MTNAPGLIALYGVCFNSEVFPVDKGAKTTASYLVDSSGFITVQAEKREFLEDALLPPLSPHTEALLII